MPAKFKTILPILLVLTSFFANTILHAHPGSTDAAGGHTNRKTGEYHYHSDNKTTSVEITSRQESGGKSATRNTKMFVVGDGSLSVRQERTELIPVTEIIRGKVVGVSDGDTIKVLNNGVQVKVRLYGIDTPEKKQAFGQAAERFTANMVAGKIVDVEPIDIDRYGRTVGLVTVNGVSLNEELVRNGFSWVYDQYCKKSFCSEWKGLEASARDNGTGLWVDRNPQAPWDWRKDRRKK